MESTGFSPPQQESPEGVTSSGSFNTPEAPAKTMRSNEGAVTTSVPVACAVPRPPVVTIHRNDRTRTRDERSQAAVSVSSAQSGNTLGVQAELLRAREIARKRRERLEAEEEELELDRQLAACSSQKRSSAGSARSNPSSGRPSPVHQNVYLTHCVSMSWKQSCTATLALTKTYRVPYKPSAVQWPRHSWCRRRPRSQGSQQQHRFRLSRLRCQRCQTSPQTYPNI